MKKTITTIAIFTTLGLYAQNNVGIGTLTPNPNAKLEVKSDDKGVLITRLTTVARNTLGTALTATEDGMLVYDKDLKAFFYWDGGALAWVQVGSGAGDNWGTQAVQIAGTNISGDGTSGSPLTVTDGDSDATNEIELPTGGTAGQVLSTDGSGTYTWVNDNAGTDDQNIANLAFDPSTNVLTVGIENGTSQTIDLTALVNDADSDVTNEIQDLSINTTTNILTITNNGSATNIDLSPYLELPTGGTAGQVLSTDGSGVYTWVNDNTGTDDQNIANLALNNTTNILTVGIENGTSQTVDLSSLTDADWYKVGTTSAPTTINDDIFTQGKVGIGIITPTSKLEIIESTTQTALTVNKSFNGLSNTDAAFIGGTDGGYTNTGIYVLQKDNISFGSMGTSLFNVVKNSVSQFVVRGNGRVGIGMVNPDESLTIINSAATGHHISLHTSGDADHWSIMKRPSTYSTSPNDFHISYYDGTNWLSHFSINPNGYTGIETQNPTSWLDVNGDLRVRTITAGTSTDQALVVDATGVVKKVAPSSPAGEVITFAGATAPAGFLMCDGSAVSRTTYANLFAVIGTTYGAGNGTTTFNLPDLRGEFIRGFDGGRGLDAGRVNGSVQSGTLVVADVDGTSTTNGLGIATINPTSGFDKLGADAINTINIVTYQTNNISFLNFGPATGGTYASRSDLFGVSRPRNVAMNYCIKF